MKGGALPLLVWVLLLALAGALNAVWTGDWIEIASFAAAVLAILALIGALVLRSRGDALRRGEPGPRPREAMARASYAAVLCGVGLAVLLFGFSFGHFIVYFGAGLLVVGLGRLAGELHAQHQAARAAGADHLEVRR